MPSNKRVLRLKGRRFGKLRVICKHGYDNWGHTLWQVRCNNCGKTSYVVGSNLLYYRHTHRGCRYCHGRPGLTKKYTSTYGSFNAMKARCFREDNISFKAYGGRGITVDPRWLGPNGFANFVLDMGPRPKGKTLDRKNPEGNYMPRNCRWATDKQQCENKRSSYSETELCEMREEAKKFAVDEVEAEIF